ncbi:MAG: glycogen/starch/alpha-glucan phosphorylase [Oscillospiraceae bacterium]|nr:glycogen/starch/alpha-glucan phosphorylase [Oscillospiraceae bacterium]
MFANKTEFAEEFEKRIHSLFGVALGEASETQMYTAIANMVREAIAQTWIKTNSRYGQTNAKQVYYFSLEFLVGKFLELNLLYIDALDVCKDGLKSLGISFDDICSIEPEAGLGNGGLGRLAACFLDSMAAMGIPGHGCGIRYKYGLFNQKIVDGYQVELPDNWLREANAWEIRKAEKAIVVKFGGNVETHVHKNGNLEFKHENYQAVLAVPYDSPIVGYKGNTVNNLRLWSAETISNDFDFASFSRGNYTEAISNKYSVEAISEVLYPDDSNYSNKVLRLKQQYFFVSAGINSIIRHYKKNDLRLADLPDYVAIHINDTHPALAVPELMRILMDEEGFSWDDAWDITTRTIAYTNHTILPEALEKWTINGFRTLLPRIFMIVDEINERFCRDLWKKYPDDWDRISSMAIIGDGYVRMANLAVVGSFSVNGVAAVHTEILKDNVLKLFYEYYPEKFNNKTNGITHRRWLVKSNPKCASLLTEKIGGRWVYDPNMMHELEQYKDDPSVQDSLAKIKRQNKVRLSNYLKATSGASIDPDSIFDVQIKRIHAYKRQLLNALHIMYLYNELNEDPTLDIAPRTFLIGGKAAPSYYYAKNIIKLITALSEKIKNNKRVREKLRVEFLENYCVSVAELVFPASDISEQISTASKEASGTGNMKFMMNGAVTIGTMDGANIEIFEHVGEDNFIVFGLSVAQVLNYYANGGYNAWNIYTADERLRIVVDQLTDGSFTAVSRYELNNIRRSLLDYNDEYFVLKDFDSYVNAQKKIDRLYRDQKHWLSMSAMNIAHSGAFSSDNTIAQYANEIWNIAPVM